MQFILLFSFIFCLAFRGFWLCLIVFVPMTYINEVFLWKAMIGVALNTFPNVLLILEINHWLLIVSVIFVKVRHIVLKMESNYWKMFFCTALILFKRAGLPKLVFHKALNQVIWMFLLFIKSWANTFYS